MSSRLAEFLPDYDVAREYRLAVAAPGDVVYSHVRALDLGSSWSGRVLYGLRGLPRTALTLEGLERLGFAVLAEEPGRELVLGLIGRFWQTEGGIIRTSAGHFPGFHEPGYAKAGWNFRILPGSGRGVILATETRVRCIDEVGRHAFRRYWRLIGPFSGWLRREALRIVKRRSEAGRGGVFPRSRMLSLLVAAALGGGMSSCGADDGDPGVEAVFEITARVR